MGTDHTRPCMADGCALPGRFVVGIDGGTTTCWCVDHIMPTGTEWLGRLVEGIREAIWRPEPRYAKNEAVIEEAKRKWRESTPDE